MPRLLLVGWDGADWKVINPLMDAGQMPHLARLVEQGAMADAATLQPALSPMLWTSIATGKRADQHGIIGFTEVDPASGGVRPVSSTSRKAKALWNILTQSGCRTHVVNWFGGHPAEPIRGICVSEAFGRGMPPPAEPWPMMPGTVHPEGLSEKLAELRVHVSEMDGELLQMFVPRAAEVDQEKDRRLISVARLQAESYSVHAAATWVMRAAPWDFMGVYYPSIDHFSHGFMHYHPPRQEWVEQKDFELYHDVVSSAYRLHDLMLGFLLELAGADTTVILVSDHGFHSDHLRPKGIPDVPAGPAVQHRPLGIFAIKGPGIIRDERIYGVSLLDITPTILALFGLPAGQDMAGRVLAEAFEAPPSLERIPSWEQVPGECGMHPAGAAMSEQDAQALIEQFIALGYVERPDENQQKAVETCLRERLWNLARVYLDANRYQDALPLLEQIHEQLPERSDFALGLADCQFRLGLLEEAQATAEAAIASYMDMPEARLVLGNILVERGEYAVALENLLVAERANPRLPGLHLRIASVYLRMRRWEDAQRACERALEIDAHSPQACQGLALCHLRQRRFEEAAEEALRAVGLDHHLPWAHFYLGIALTRLGRTERAIQAFQSALTFHPALRAGHAWLARIYSKMPGCRDKAWSHFRQAREAARARVLADDRLETIRQEARRRVAVRSRERAARPAAQPGGAAAPAAAATGPALEFTIVSGLPRSGTSLMMQMLEAAGLPVMTDSQRPPDDDNPRGYYEWEAIKKVRRRPEILREAQGKVVKVISMLAPWLPNQHRYKVIFMERAIEEVIASQRKMVSNRGREIKADPERMQANLARHRTAVLDLLTKSPNFQVLMVDYAGLVRKPDQWISRIIEFLGDARLDAGRMASVIQPELYRQRASPVQG
jgi:predicted AlkP superfamily phosphohydrolase/phosphomutase/tetratricopeptide (TPR) repeat protein